MKIFKFLAAAALVASCNSPKAVFDYDETVNFSQYKTYQIFPDFQSGLSQLDEARLLESLKEKMGEEGFTQGENANVYVNVYTEEYEQDNRSRLGIGLGGGGGNVGVGVSGGVPVGTMDNYYKLTFDFIDVEKDALVWQAVVESPFNLNATPEKRKAQFDAIVEKALAGYPPKK
ncbi:DUF4136 domain-containing protein [Gramella sp. AN32]|uniref:DUF4136 domain-containing protein n=1 Tax=Christiangramia antarctica TaxID=2058158 RepID=A0ABW5X4E6_9FLAO|nr:DUF4136 domain-containing protein [Gramella sp. AN32]MCM4157495.1 DUF4136 domain-containing protein [Gramella sp. AN32]